MYFEGEDSKSDKTTAPIETLDRLKDEQIYPYIFLHLCKSINIYSGSKCSDIGRFYAGVKDWHHDQHLFLILLMIQQGMLLDFSQVDNTKLSIEDNSINLVCGVVSLLDVELGEPWEAFDLKVDKHVQSFYYLANLIRDSINSFIESILFRTIMSQKLVMHKQYQQLHNKIKFKDTKGKYFATILKSVLQYNFPAEGEKVPFSAIEWPWLKLTSVDNFIDVLKEALTLWDSVYKMVADLSSKSKVTYLGTAFANANYVLKAKIDALNITELL